ncbi:MAG: hypothetical protein ABEH58_01395 [Haloplanus sp.]
MSEREVTVDARDHVPVDRWKQLGLIDGIRRRVRRIAIGAGILFLGLTLAPGGGDLSAVLGVVRLLSLATGVSAWSVSAALAGAIDGDEEDDSILAAVGVVVLVALAWSAERSTAGTVLWRALLGDAAASAAGADAGASTGVDIDVDASADATAAGARGESGKMKARPRGTYLGIVAVLLVGGAVLLASAPGFGGGEVGARQVGAFLLLTAVVGGVVGLVAALSLR